MAAHSANKAPWTYHRFINKVKIIHGDKFDYSKILPTDNISRDSDITITYNTCYYIWTTSIGSHINKRSGCPACSHKAPWTYNRFIEASKLIHDDKYNYGLIIPEEIHNTSSTITIGCKTCNHKWSTTIASHINHQSGCPNCSACLKYTLEIFFN